MRAYTVAATAVTLGVSKKWVDNILSHHQVEGVIRERQGVVRRVTPDGLLNLEIALCLNRTMAIPIKAALNLAGRLVKAEGGEVALEGDQGVWLRMDVQGLSKALRSRLDRALEITPTPKRGRPSRK